MDLSVKAPEFLQSEAIFDSSLEIGICQRGVHLETAMQLSVGIKPCHHLVEPEPPWKSYLLALGQEEKKI